MNLIEYPDAELMVFDLADRLASELGVALRQNDRASFCVAGGTTPAPVYDVLSAVKLPWDRVTIFPSDERWVPERHERSNAGMIRKRLLRGQAAAAEFVSLHEEVAKPELALDRLRAAIEPHLPISVLLLGMGEDMHTASLFPKAEGLAEALAPDAPAVHAIRVSGASEPRVTLSADVLEGAMSCHILITGAAKRKALDDAQKLPKADAPVRAVLSNATVHWAP